jgi:ring-1,2-phenylacetyl-CoA epoxidase subunit PaaA
MTFFGPSLDVGPHRNSTLEGKNSQQRRVCRNQFLDMYVPKIWEISLLPDANLHKTKPVSLGIHRAGKISNA